MGSGGAVWAALATFCILLHGPVGAQEWNRSPKQVQQALVDFGFKPGAVDGVWGKKSASALRAFQKAQGLSETGVLDEATSARLFAPNRKLADDIVKELSTPAAVLSDHPLGATKPDLPWGTAPTTSQSDPVVVRLPLPPASTSPDSGRASSPTAAAPSMSSAAEPRRQPTPKAAAIYDPVVDVHPAVRRTVQSLRRCKPSEGFVSAIGEGLCGVKVGHDSIERAAHVLDQLARGLEMKGIPLVPTGQAAQVASGPDKAIFNLKERVRTVPHVPTQQEIAEEERRQEQRERHWRNPSRWPHPPYGSVYPENDTIWTGELSVQIEGYSDGVRRKWADGRTQRLENLVPSIVDGIVVLLAARKASREEREETHRRWAEMQRRRDLARARAKREEARLAFAEEVFKLTREADALRAWFAQGHVTVAQRADGSVGRFQAWMEDRLNAIERRLETAAIERALNEKKLFPTNEKDELYDPLGDPEPGRW